MTQFIPMDYSLTFEEWLFARYETTAPELYRLSLETGRYGDFDRMMEWYRRRYRKEMSMRAELQSSCPFKKGGNYDGNDQQNEDTGTVREHL